MIREERLYISKKPYAVDPTSLRVTTNEPDRPEHHRTHRVHIDAVWFRRRRGVTVATIGTLWDFQRDPAPADVHEALRRHDDGRYGGSWIARWDGESYVSEVPQPLDVMTAHLELLRPMLENYPDVPPGHDGWYRFETSEERRAQSESASRKSG